MSRGHAPLVVQGGERKVEGPLDNAHSALNRQMVMKQGPRINDPKLQPYRQQLRIPRG
jgi:hypothetical protein